MPQAGMRPVLLAVLLLASAVCQASAGGWFSDLFANPLKGIQRRLQQQQQQRLAHLDHAATEAAGFAGRRLQQSEQQPVEQGSYGYGGYGGYGGATTASTGYGYYGYNGEAAAESSNSGSSRSLLAAASHLAPSLVYDEPEGVQHRVLAGMRHQDDIELTADTTVVVPGGVFELPTEQRAARKLLVANSDLAHVTVAVEQPAVLQPVDVLLPGPTRALLQADVGGGYGGYGTYGSYYGETVTSAGYGYGYGSQGVPASSSGAGRSLLEVAEGDDVQLYNLWLQQYNKQQHAQ